MLGTIPSLSRTYEVMGKLDSNNLIVGKIYYDDTDGRLYMYSPDDTRSNPNNGYFPIWNGKTKIITKFSNEKYLKEVTPESITKLSASINAEVAKKIRYQSRRIDNDEVLKHLQKLATEKLKPVSAKLDISSFTILKKPVSNVSPIFQNSSARVVKWVLPAQESIVLMKEFSGSELEKLREYSENSRSVDSLNRRFFMIYDHIVSPKPATFEQWLKSVPFEDIDHYFFAIYIASFKGANFLPEDCINKGCGETFITDDINTLKKKLKAKME